MLTTYTENALCEMLKQHSGIYTSASGMEIITQQGMNINERFRNFLDAWHKEQLLTANPDLLPVQNISQEMSGVATACNNVGVISLPDAVFRVVGIKMPEWPITVSRFIDAESPEGERVRLNPFAASVSRPKVLIRNNTVWLYRTSVKEGRLPLSEISVVMKPQPGVYRFDNRLLEDLLNSASKTI